MSSFKAIELTSNLAQLKTLMYASSMVPLMDSGAANRLARVYSSQTNRAFEYDTIVRMTQGFYGQENGYNYNVLKNQLAKADIAPIDFLIFWSTRKLLHKLRCVSMTPLLPSS